jgi:hypothetical protein
MNNETAWWLWDSVCTRHIGIDGNGDEINEMTAVAGAAIALDIPVYKCNIPVNRAKVAQFLRDWADALVSVA